MQQRSTLANDGILHFTTDWFTPHIPLFTRHILPFAGKKHLRFLEIGCFEGRSSCWMLQHVLTHPTSTLTCIDTFAGSHEHRLSTGKAPEGMEERFDNNIRAVGASNRVCKIKGKSFEVLRTLDLHSYDFVYIDGSHFSADVLTDAVLGWGLLKTGGLLLFDDYKWNFYKTENSNPKAAIDAFLKIFTPELSVIERGWQVLVQKCIRNQDSIRPHTASPHTRDTVAGSFSRRQGDRSKSLSISWVRNEEDILESFVRHHSKIFDDMIIVLHRSTDRSQQILEALQDEGLSIDIRFDATSYHAQSEALTYILHEIEGSRYQRIMPLDADEFLYAPEGNARDILRSLNDGEVYSAPWVTYVPTLFDDISEPDPLKRIRHRRTEEPREFSKVIIPGNLASSCSLPRGNHTLHQNGLPMPVIAHPQLRLAHFPLRSPQQARRKILESWQAVRNCPSFVPGTSYQWETLFKRCSDPADITYEELSAMALRYALKPEDREPNLIADPFALPSDAIESVL